MSNAAPVILEVALNGVTRREQNPAAPNSPEEVARDALACLDAGAAIIHTHNDTPTAPPDAGAERYARAYRSVMAARPDALLYPTVGFGEGIEARFGHHEPLAREGLIRAAALDTGSVNIGAIGGDGLPPDWDFVYTNSPADIRHMAGVCERLGLGPSVAVFEPGFLRVVIGMHDAGRLPRGTLVKLYFSAGGYLGAGEPIFGAPPIREALDLYLAMLGERPLPWAVAVLGGSLLETPVARLALERGGHLRVGLEDQPDAKSNLAEVEGARALCTKVGRPLATPAQTAAMLDLPDGGNG